MSVSAGLTVVLTHNIGGNVDNYVVDLQFKSFSGNIHNEGYGGDARGTATNRHGARWFSLTTTLIRVYREENDFNCGEVRVRIWVYN